jgi:anaerobic magnesium-protoporphyrin IX monomethyl ester cyclase
MKNIAVVFIAILDYDNLGIGYMASTLSEAGIKSKVIDLHKNKQEILRTLKKIDPLVIGFSILFHNHIDEFIDLINFLRRKGVSCHFTAGGHYASLRPEELFELIPHLDSIVRFEGEYILPELAKQIISGEDWRKTMSIAYKQNGKMILNPLRPLEKDLDKFPFPERLPLKEYAFKKNFATILA